MLCPMHKQYRPCEQTKLQCRPVDVLDKEKRMKNTDIIKCAFIQKNAFEKEAKWGGLGSAKRFLGRAWQAAKVPLRPITTRIPFFNPGKKYVKTQKSTQDLLDQLRLMRNGGYGGTVPQDVIDQARRNFSSNVKDMNRIRQAAGMPRASKRDAIRSNLTLNRGGTAVDPFSARASDINRGIRSQMGDAWRRFKPRERQAAIGMLYGGTQGAGYLAGLATGDGSGERHYDHLANLGFGDRLMALYDPKRFAEIQAEMLRKNNPNRQGFLSLIPGVGGLRAGRSKIDRAVTNQFERAAGSAGLTERLMYTFAPRYTIDQLRRRAQAS